MKKSLTLASVFSLALSGAAMAVQVPADLAKTDQILAGYPDISATQIENEPQLAADTTEPHDTEEYPESVDILDEALEILEGGGDGAPQSPIIEIGDRPPCG